MSSDFYALLTRRGSAVRHLHHEAGYAAAAGEDGEYEDGLAGNDVFIVEGEQEQYGSKDAWAVARR